MELNERSKFIRRETLKLSKANGGYHYGGSFSATEIMIALYDHILTDADKFILSKGHAAFVQYVLLMERGFRPSLEGHPHRDEHNGIHATTGSLGHGLPIAVGMALARKQTNAAGRIFVLIGDGESQEGTTWESMLTAAHRDLNNLCAIVDVNGIQGSGFTADILPVNCLADVAAAIGWNVVTINGHDPVSLNMALNERPMIKPLMIIAKTVKGAGVSYMEGKPEWHSNWVGGELYEKTMKELE